jgi:hypothetical protein
VEGGENFDNTDPEFSYVTDGQADAYRCADIDFIISHAALENESYLQTDDTFYGQADGLSSSGYGGA